LEGQKVALEHHLQTTLERRDAVASEEREKNGVIVTRIQATAAEATAGHAAALELQRRRADDAAAEAAQHVESLVAALRKTEATHAKESAAAAAAAAAALETERDEHRRTLRSLQSSCDALQEDTAAARELRRCVDERDSMLAAQTVEARVASERMVSLLSTFHGDNTSVSFALRSGRDRFHDPSFPHAFHFHLLHARRRRSATPYVTARQ
jgi:hypothetical protein